MAESKGLESGLIPKLATGFCAGIARTGGMCGAVSGAVMAIGLVMGRSHQKQPVNECFMKIQELIKIFNDRFGSINCRELTGCDLGMEEGQQYFKENNVREKCLDFTSSAAGIVMTLIKEPS